MKGYIMKIHAMVLLAVVFSIPSHAWFGTLACAPHLFGKALCTTATVGCKALGFVAKGTANTGLWAFKHPFVTVGATCAVLYADKNLRDKFCGAATYMFDKYKQWSPQSRLVGAVDFAHSVYHFFKPTQEEQEAKRLELEQQQNRARELEAQVSAHQKQNELLSQQLGEVQGQVKVLNEQLVVARNTQQAMIELSSSFELLTKNVKAMTQQLDGDNGLVGTMNVIKRELGQLAGKMQGLDGEMSHRVQQCLSDVQKLLDQADGTRRNELRNLNDTVASNLEAGTHRILEQVRQIIRSNVPETTGTH